LEGGKHFKSSVSDSGVAV